jgi:hypothetical protein
MDKMQSTRKAVLLTLALATSLGLILGCGSGQKKKEDPTVLRKASWRETLPSGSFRSNVPVRMTLLHSGQPTSPGLDMEAYMKNLQQQHVQKGWGDLGAHYYISPGGAIAEGRSTFLQGRLENDQEFDRSGHVFITLLGDYDQQELDPLVKQKIADFFVWLSEQKTLSLESVKGLSDYMENTTSPGRHVTEWLASKEYENMIKISLGIPVDTPTPTPSPTPGETPTPRRRR